MKTIIAGSRTITDYSLVEDAVRKSGFHITRVVSGHARGVDTLGEQWANEHIVPLVIFEAHWEVFGKRAGIIRNCEMASYADALIAIWDGQSKGTAHMIDAAKRAGLKVYVYDRD
jgi:hypothetical protein